MKPQPAIGFLDIDYPGVCNKIRNKGGNVDEAAIPNNNEPPYHPSTGNVSHFFA